MAENELKNFKVVVMGGSAGSLDVLLYVLPLLPEKINAAIIIVLHRKMSADSPLVELLSMKTHLKVSEAEEKQNISPGHIYIAPADYHLLLEKNHTLSLDYSEKIHYSRPSIDVCFESAADVFGENLTGVLLSGANADGVEGLMKIKQAGGTAIVQDPITAEVAFMPAEAIRHGLDQNIFSPMQIAAFLSRL